MTLLPEDDYLGCTLPTHSLSELRQFRDHFVYLLQHHPDYQMLGWATLPVLEREAVDLSRDV